MKLIHIAFVFLLMIAPFSLKGQALDEGKSLFLAQRYAEALPIFQAEYENTPDDAALNQWLGACLFETGSLMESEKYLAFASKKNIPESFIYLGELYAKMYRFTDAEKEFAKYERVKRRDKEALAKLQEKRNYADRLQRAINRTEDVQIIDSIIVSKSSFLSAYNLSASAGSIMSMNDFFNNRANSTETAYMNERKDKVYYSMGDTLTGYDLYSMEKLIDTFGNEKKLSETINGTGHQAYPFIMPDGITLYFASTGHESFGGYDLFVTRYNINTDSYLTPNHLNMPFNSPFNDYMMAIDEEKGIGWFASDRFQPADSVCVYTFIPNAKVTLLESKDEPELLQRAKIARIADTWKENSDYTALRTRATQRTTKQEQYTGDFTFVINDQTTYHTLNDFRNPQARNLYAQVVELERKLQSAQKELNMQRERFINDNNASLRSAILNAEKETENMFKEIEQLKLRARNEEIRNTF